MSPRYVRHGFGPAGALVALALVAGLSGGVLAEDGGGVSVDDSSASGLGQVADLLGNGEDLNGQGASDLFQADGSLNQDVNLHQTEVSPNWGQVTPEQMGQALENRTPSSQGSSRGQGSQSRSR